MSVVLLLGGRRRRRQVAYPTDSALRWDPNPGSFFQDSARTTPANVGDPVGGVLDRSGNGRHGSAAGVSRPFVIDGSSNGSGQPALRFDGVSNYLSVLAALTGTAPGHTTIAVLRWRATNNYPMLVVPEYAQVELRGQGNSSSIEYLSRGADSASLGGSQIGPWLRVIGRSAADGSLTLTVNGVTGPATAGLPYTLGANGGAASVGARPDGSLPATADFRYVEVFARPLTAGEMALADPLLLTYVPA